MLNISCSHEWSVLIASLVKNAIVMRNNLVPEWEAVMYSLDRIIPFLNNITAHEFIHCIHL